MLEKVFADYNLEVTEDFPWYLESLGLQLFDDEEEGMDAYDYEDYD